MRSVEYVDFIVLSCFVIDPVVSGLMMMQKDLRRTKTDEAGADSMVATSPAHFSLSLLFVFLHFF
jgi:hypothetical protein